MRTALIQKTKLILGYTVAGIIFAIASTLTTSVIAGALNLEFSNSVQGVTSVFFNPTDGMSIAFTALSLLILGVYIWLFGYAGAYIKAKITGGTKPKLQKRPHLIGLLLMGVTVIAVFSILDQALTGIEEDGTLTDTGSLIEAFTTFNLISILYRIVAFSVLGFVVIWLGGHFATIEDKVPKQLKKF